MEESHRSKKRRTDRWSSAEASGAQSSLTQSDHATTSSRNGDNKTLQRHRQAGGSEDSRRPPPRRADYKSSYRAQTNATGKPRQQAPSFNRPRAQNQYFHPKNHSTKSRKENPSTRIRSLRKQLAHASAATLPANVLAEKERELQYLLDSRKEPQTATENVPKRDRKEKKTLSQYHMVRFFERKKAERYLRRIRKEIDGQAGQEEASGQAREKATPEASQKKLQRHECDLLYCLFAPLGEKYIALFAGDGQSEKSKTRKATTKEAGAPQGGLPTDNPHLIRISTQGQDDTFRPSHWYTIERILATTQTPDGPKGDLIQVPQDNDAYSSITITPSQLQQLEALRDGKTRLNSSSNPPPGLAVRSKDPPLAPGQKKRKIPSWQEETDAPIDPMDADSSSDDGGMALADVGGDEEEDSDGDGGFFDR